MSRTLELLGAPGQTIIITPGDEKPDLDERFERACRAFPDGHLEMDEDGNIIVAPGNSEESSCRSMEAAYQLKTWADRDGTGRALDSSATFNLPSGAKRSPDAAWVSRSVLQREGRKTRTITKTRHVPPFLIEVVSPSDRLTKQQEKCRKWIEAGVFEAFLIDPDRRTVYVYSADGSVTEYADPVSVASQVLPGFTLECSAVWQDFY